MFFLKKLYSEEQAEEPVMLPSQAMLSPIPAPPKNSPHIHHVFKI